MSSAKKFIYSYFFIHKNYDTSIIFINKISTHGLISFGEGYTNWVPQSFPLSDDYWYEYGSGQDDDFIQHTIIYPDIISPYWDDIDLRVKGNILYESYDSDSPDILETISDFVTKNQNLLEIFDCKSAVVFFWSDVCPLINNNCFDVSNFDNINFYTE